MSKPEMNVEEMHHYARSVAAHLRSPDKKHLRFNDIVRVAQMFYPNCIEAGLRELVMSCDKDDGGLYCVGRPMWAALEKEYAWMLDA